jgi:hypothetical protein
MHRIDGSDVDVDLHGSGKDGFTDGDPSVPTPATVITDDWLNAVQEELSNAIETYGGQALVKGTNDQLSTVLDDMNEHTIELLEADAGESSNFTSEVIGGTGVGTITVPDLYAGMTIRFHAVVMIESTDGGDFELGLWMNAGSTFYPLDYEDSFTSGTERQWVVIQGRARIKSIGSPGKLAVGGVMNAEGDAGAVTQLVKPSASDDSVTEVDVTDTDLTISLVGIWDVAGANRKHTIVDFQVDVENP